MKQLTPTQQDRVLRELRGRGFNDTQLHDLTGLSISQVRQRLAKPGIESIGEGAEKQPPPPKEPRLQPPPNPGPLFKKLYLVDHLTLAQIMAKYDIGYRKLRDHLRAQRVEFRPSKPRYVTEPATEEMIADYALMNFKAMALKYHMDRQTLRRRLVLAGVEIRPRGRPWPRP